MALYRNLWNLSVEEDDVTGAAGGEAVSTIAPEEAAEQAAEVQEQAEVVESDAVALEESMEAIEELQESVETNEEVLENNPEAVTEEMVAASNECYAFSMGVLGIKRDDFLANRVSLEAYSSPAEKLKVSTEAMKEHIKNAIERIKLFFKQLGVQIKKLFVKILAMFNTSEKRAKELIKEIKKLDNIKPDKDNEEMKSLVENKGLLLTKNLEKHYMTIEGGDPMVVEENVAASKSLLGIAGEIESSDPFENSKAQVIRVFPNAVGVIYASEEDERPKVTYKVVKIDISKSDYAKTDMSKDEVLKLLDTAASLGRSIKKLGDNAGRAFDKAINEAEKIYKKTVEDEGISRDEKSKAKMQLAVSKIKAARVYSEGSLGIMARANAIIVYASAWKTQARKDSKKKDKDK